jgi:DNA polymerase elongation subunit (family B)
MKLEEEEIYAGYFRPDEDKEDFSDGLYGKAKTYLLVEQDKEGKFNYTIHGSAFKGSHHTKLFTSIIEDIGFKMLMLDFDDREAVKQFEEDISKYYNKGQWTLELLKQRNKCKPLDQYKTVSPKGAQLVQQYEKRFKKKIKINTQLEYVKIKSKHSSTHKLITPFDEIDDVTDIDYDYYTEIVDEAFKRLDLFDRTPKGKKKGKQKSIFDFGA